MLWIWIWGIITAVSLVIEFLTSNLILIWFAAGGLVTLLVVALVPGINPIWQFTVFAGTSVLLLVFIRKFCLKLTNHPSDKNSN